MTLRFTLAALLVSVSAQASPADDAKPHLDAAAAAYKDKKWRVALDELNKANAIDPKPELHFSIGQVYAKLGKCHDAIHAYEQFLASKPADEPANMAKEAIDACKAQLPKEPVKEPQAVEPPIEKPLPPPAPRHWYQDKLDVSLVVGGAAAMLVGGTFYVLARGTLSDAEDAPTYGEQDDLYGSAKTKRLASVVFAGAGAVALGIGIVRAVTKQPAADRGVGLAPTRDGGFVTWTSPF